MLNKNQFDKLYVGKDVKMKSNTNINHAINSIKNRNHEDKNIKKLVSGVDNIKNNIISTKKLIDDANNISSISDNVDESKLARIQEKIENTDKNVDKIHLHSHKLNDIEDILEEIVEDTKNIYNDSLIISKETKQIFNDIKEGDNVKLVHDFSQIIDNSNEIVNDTREIVNDFRYIYKLASSLIPVTLWGIYVFIYKRPK